MKAGFLIAKRDFKEYFASPMAYIILAMFLGIMGWMFFNSLVSYQMEMQSVAFGARPTLSDAVIKQLYGNMNVILLFVVPFITMKLFSEEKKEHTIELLITAPISNSQIILGKFCSALIFLVVLIGATAVYPLILSFIAHPDWGVIGGCYLGLFFVAATYIAVGLFWSSRTENQIVSAVLTFGSLLFFWLINWASQQAGPVLGEVISYLSVIGHFMNFTQGIIDTTDIIYYLSFISFALFLTHASFDSNFWE